jgi:hypothetical protein
VRETTTNLTGEIKMKKTNYKKIELAVERVIKAREELNKIANLRIGVISGGPSIDEENKEFNEALNDLLPMVKAAVKQNCQKDALLKRLNGDHVSISLAKELIKDREFEKEYERTQR